MRMPRLARTARRAVVVGVCSCYERSRACVRDPKGGRARIVVASIAHTVHSYNMIGNARLDAYNIANMSVCFGGRRIGDYSIKR